MKTTFTSNNKYFKGVNFDYILALRNKGDAIEKVCLEISKDERIIDDLFRMLEDEASEADDMYYRFRRQYENQGDYEYCLGLASFKSHHIEPISYPSFDETEYRKLSEEYKERISSAKNERVREIIKNHFEVWNRKQKQKCIDQCLPYVFAYNYHKAVVEKEIEKKFLIYSNENHGWFKRSKDVTEDIKIEVRTNFCYGSSSKMLVIVTYKGIPILPYSVWVNYFYANYNEIIRCTRSYNADRNNWNTCMDFVVWFVEKAIENPEAFVKDTIKQEVERLVEGLEKLFKMTDKEMKDELMTEGPHEFLQNKFYIGIKTARMADEKDKRYYSIAPEEAKLVYRMEKITGALHFLKSLRQLSEVYDGIEHSLAKIKEINALLYPEIVNAIYPVKEHVAEIKAKLKPIKKRLSIVEKNFDVLYNRLQKRLEKAEYGKEDEVKEAFKKKNPQYEMLREEMVGLRSQVYSLEAQINNREHYLNQLEDAKSLILRHVVLKTI